MEKGDQFIVARGPFMGFEATVVDKTADGKCFWCDVDIFGNVSLKVFLTADILPRSRAELSNLVEDLNPAELKTLRAIINGKLSKRSISPEQQAAMQAGRKRKGK